MYLILLTRYKEVTPNPFEDSQIQYLAVKKLSVLSWLWYIVDHQ